MTTNNSISILLIALIVACPLRCFAADGCQDSVDVATVSVPSCCDCDSQKSLPESGQSSTPSIPDQCPCVDCVCNGAISVDENSSEFAIAELGFYDCWSEFVPIVETTTVQVFQASVILPVFSDRADARAALCCWII